MARPITALLPFNYVEGVWYNLVPDEVTLSKILVKLSRYEVTPSKKKLLTIFFRKFFY